MTTVQMIVVGIAVVVFVVPFVTYTSVKLGTYAYFKGRQLFEKEIKNGET